MALTYINIGNFANDGTGDDVRTAFDKVNKNFNDLELQGGQANTISNVGTGVGLYKEKIGVNLRLKSLLAGSGIALNSSNNEITITNTAPSAIITVNADTGTLTATPTSQALNIVGGTGVTTHISGTTLTITGNDYHLNTDHNPTLIADLQLNGHGIFGDLNTSIVAGEFHGNLSGNVYGIDIRNVQSEVRMFDFGKISGIASTPSELWLMLSEFDMGTFTDPWEMGIDGGTII